MINKIRDNLYNNKGKHIVVIMNGSRNKKEKFDGIVNGVYRNIFSILMIDGRTKSFSYADILTKMVEIHYK